VLQVDRAACEWFARRLADHRCGLGTRKGIRRLTPWAHAVFTLLFLIDPWRIGTIARACLVFFHIERPRRLVLTQRAASAARREVQEITERGPESRP
jgi:hypothetical protein